MTTTDHQQAAERLRGELRGRKQARPRDTFANSLVRVTQAADDHDAILGALIGIVASIPAPQQPQERPETAPDGDGTTDPVSGRETGAQRDGSHRPGHAFTPAVEYPTGDYVPAFVENIDLADDAPAGAQRGDHGWHTMPPGSFVIDGEDRSDRYQCRHDGTGVVHLRYKDDGPAGARRFKVGDRVQVRVAGSDYAATVIKADDGRFCRVRHDDGGHTAFAHVSWLEPLPPVEPAQAFPPGGIARVRDFGAGHVVAANGNYRTVRINGADVEYHVSWLRPWTEPTPDPVDLPTTPGSVRAEEGLRLIAAWGCETSTRWPTDPMPCYTDGRTPDAQYGADRCCAPCIAWHHLVDAGTVA